MNFIWFIQTTLLSFITIVLIHYLYVYFIDNFTESKLKDPEIVHSNYNEILNITQNPIENKKVLNYTEETTHTMNMEEELKKYLQQQMTEQLN
jgi:hypothetical protein|tara:strand:- start:87 stop:365 length:279 start_codon:yes stop_codon:yes gene_type:complete